jgi:hypothetical protein
MAASTCKYDYYIPIFIFYGCSLDLWFELDYNVYYADGNFP